ncbi:MAG: hypothetical protein KDD40_11120, partial [Bdellovibrionales bacterium]|nr:hypothetical protein [Bdellovibrionales bacterium]
ENPEIKKTIVWAILPTDQDIAGKPRTGQINYTVKNMEEMLAHLAAKNIAVDDMKNYDYGKFAWIKDPEGNQIELWEPA